MLRYVLPTVVAPRYAPAAHPPPPTADRAEARSDAAADYRLSFHLTAVGGIAAAESPTHAIDAAGEEGSVTCALRSAPPLDGDLVVLLRRLGGGAAGWIDDGDDERGALVRFAVPQTPPDRSGLDLVFVVDRSGSMSGGQIARARDALQLLLRSVPADRPCTVNIVSFGSHCEQLYDAGRAYDDECLAHAAAHVVALQADMGGTEILAPLRAALAAPPAGGRRRCVFVLTDGEVCNVAQVVAAVRDACGGADARQRVFSVGIGAGVSHALVEGIADAGHGHAEFVAGAERLEPKMMRLMRAALAPPVAARVEVDGPEIVHAAPVSVPCAGGDVRAHLIVRGPAGAAPAARLVTAGCGAPVAAAVPLAAAPRGAAPLAALAAHALIRGGAVKGPDALAAALRHQVLAPGTAMVAVREGGAAALPGAPPALRHVPLHTVRRRDFAIAAGCRDCGDGGLAADSDDDEDYDDDDDDDSLPEELPLAACYSTVVRPLLDLVEDLHRLLEGHGGFVPLPKIAVVGTQSSGKSSLLERLSTITLPRGDGLCTRVPLMLSMKQNPTRTVAKLSYDGVVEREVPLDAVSAAIDAATIALAGWSTGVVDKTVRLRVEGEGLPDLTLTELPGIVYNPVGEQPKDIAKQVKDLIIRHISEKDVLILCVFAGDVDLQASEALALAREVDPLGERTVGCITKLDLVQSRQALRDCVLQAGGHNLGIKLGLTAVRNRSLAELHEGITNEEVNRREAELIQELAELDDVPAAALGTPALVRKLCELQRDNVRKVLPLVRIALQKELASAEARLAALPTCSAAPAAKRPRLGAGQCPAGHALAQVQTPGDDSNVCDDCGQRGLPKGTCMHRCPTCDYDRCAACAEGGDGRRGLVLTLEEQEERQQLQAKSAACKDGLAWLQKERDQYRGEQVAEAAAAPAGTGAATYAPLSGGSAARGAAAAVDGAGCMYLPLVTLQHASGYWVPSPQLARALGVDGAALRGQLCGDDEWCTAVCIAWLRAHCAADAAEWGLVVQKADAWLRPRFGNTAAVTAAAAAAIAAEA